MPRWKLFDKSKDEKKPEPEETIKEEEEKAAVEITQEPEVEPLAEYSETLQSGVTTSKKASSSKKGTIISSDQRIWRDIVGIEGKIDNIHITRAEKPVTELDKTVDKLISKRKKK